MRPWTRSQNSSSGSLRRTVSELGGFPHENLIVVRYWVLSPTNAERLEPFLCDWYAVKRPLNVELQFSVYLMDDSEAF